MNDRHQGLDYDRLGVLTGALLVTLGLTRLLVLPARPITLGPSLGLSLNFQLSTTMIMALLVLGLSLTGVESLLRGHPAARAGRLPRTLVHWILPGLLGMALAIWLGRLNGFGLWTLGLLAGAVPLPLALVVEYRLVAPQTSAEVWLPWLLSFLVHLTALLLFYLIVTDPGGILVGSAAVFIVGGLLALRLLWLPAPGPRPAILGAALAGLILSLLTLLRDSLGLASLRGGLLLVLAFYLVVNVLAQRLAGRRERGLLIEYGLVVLAGLVALLFFVP